MRLIAAVLATEIYEVFKYQRKFSEPRYTGNLQRLPRLPDERGDES